MRKRSRQKATSSGGFDMSINQAARERITRLAQQPRRWLVTGSAGFIGSHLLEQLLKLGQHVTSLDNFATGHRHNLEEVRRTVGEEVWSRHRFIEGDIRDLDACRDACANVE